jgi:hypothetical protein
MLDLPTSTVLSNLTCPLAYNYSFHSLSCSWPTVACAPVAQDEVRFLLSSADTCRIWSQYVTATVVAVTYWVFWVCVQPALD